jgi:hypothetical protein
MKWAFAALSVSAFGCAVDASSPSSERAAPEGPLDDASILARYPGAQIIHRDPGVAAPKSAVWWEGDFASAPSFHTSYNLCVLSGVSGDFHFSDPVTNSVDLVANSAGRWVGYFDVPGTGYQICTKWYNFVTGDERTPILTENVDVEFSAIDEARSEDTFPGDFATFVAGMAGEFEGGGEYVSAEQSGSLTENSRIKAQTLVGHYLPWPQSAHIWGNAYAVGFAGGTSKLVNLWGYANGAFKRGTINSAGTFTFDVSTLSGYSSYWMADTDRAVCYLSRISGNLDGGGEGLRIVKNGSQWFLKSWAASGRSAMGSARCLAYDQR